MSHDERDKRPFYFAAILHRSDLSYGARMTYGALETYADDDGECFPSMDTLAERLGLRGGRSAICRWIAELEQANPPAISRRRVTRSRKDSTRYRLLLAWPRSTPNGPGPGQMCLDGLPSPSPDVLPKPQPSVAETATDLLMKRQPSVAVSAREQTINKPGNKPRNTHALRGGPLEHVAPELLPISAPDGAGVSGFAVFWERWPKKVAKAEAERAWRTATKGIHLEGILAGLEAWVVYWRAEATATGFIPYPATWLRGRRWEDPPTPAGPAGDRRLASLADFARRRGLVQ